MTTFPPRKSDKDLIELAEELIEKKAGEFHPEKFKDTYTVALRELIEAKQETANAARHRGDAAGQQRHQPDGCAEAQREGRRRGQ